MAVSDSLIDNCNTKAHIDHHIDDDNDRESLNSHHTIDGLSASSSSSDADSSESSRSREKSNKRSRSSSDDRRGNTKKPNLVGVCRWKLKRSYTSWKEILVCLVTMIIGMLKGMSMQHFVGYEAHNRFDLIEM